MTPEEHIAQVEARLAQFEKLFANHKHLEFDQSKPLDSTSGTTLYGGYVNSNGTAGTPFPTGWSSSLTAHLYTVTHNLGTANFAVCLTAFDAARVGEVHTRTTTTFTCEFFDLSASLQDVPFMFLLSA